MTDKAHPSGSETVTVSLLGYILAELKEDLLKNQHGAGAAEDGERLAGKQRVGHSSHGGAEQGLNGALKHTVEIQTVGLWHKTQYLECYARALTMRPSVASPSNPPKVITGDMQAQYRKRKEATHWRLIPSLKSLR